MICTRTSGRSTPRHGPTGAALRYFRLAADAGHRGAPLMLGLFYHLRAVEIGRVDPFPMQSTAMQALYWLGRAERGDPNPKGRTMATEKIAELAKLFPDAVKALAEWQKNQSGPPPPT